MWGHLALTLGPRQAQCGQHVFTKPHPSKKLAVKTPVSAYRIQSAKLVRVGPALAPGCLHRSPPGPNLGPSCAVLDQTGSDPGGGSNLSYVMRMEGQAKFHMTQLATFGSSLTPAWAQRTHDMGNGFFKQSVIDSKNRGPYQWKLASWGFGLRRQNPQFWSQMNFNLGTWAQVAPNWVQRVAPSWSQAGA